MANFPLQRKDILPLLLAHEPRPRRRPFRLYSVDVKPVPRPYAYCLRDRHFVHRSTPVPGQEPVTVGPAYSLLAHLPEKTSPQAPAWVLPYNAARVPSSTSYVEVGRRQCQDVIRHHTEAPENLLFLGDSGYCRRAFIYPLVAEEGANVVVRLRNNRVVYALQGGGQAGSCPSVWRSLCLS